MYLGGWSIPWCTYPVYTHHVHTRHIPTMYIPGIHHPGYTPCWYPVYTPVGTPNTPLLVPRIHHYWYPDNTHYGTRDTPTMVPGIHLLWCPGYLHIHQGGHIYQVMPLIPWFIRSFSLVLASFLLFSPGYSWLSLVIPACKPLINRLKPGRYPLGV